MQSLLEALWRWLRWWTTASILKLLIWVPSPWPSPVPGGGSDCSVSLHCFCSLSPSLYVCRSFSVLPCKSYVLYRKMPIEQQLHLCEKWFKALLLCHGMQTHAVLLIS